MPVNRMAHSLSERRIFVRTVSLDWSAFYAGTSRTKQDVTLHRAIAEGLTLISAASTPISCVTPLQTVEAATHTSDAMTFSSDASWADYIVPLIKHQALPLTVTMVCWAALEMILRHPSSAIDRAKWAVLGYLGMQFVIPFVRGLGHRFGDLDQ
jgi:hypothetical protein